MYQHEVPYILIDYLLNKFPVFYQSLQPKYSILVLEYFSKYLYLYSSTFQNPVLVLVLVLVIFVLEYFCPVLASSLPNAGLMLVYCLHAEPTLAQYWVTVSCLAPRWMWASVTDREPTLTHNWFKASCRYRQHTGTTRMKYWLGLNGYWPAPQTVGQNWTSFGSTSRVCWECWQATLCLAHRRVWRY